MSTTEVASSNPQNTNSENQSTLMKSDHDEDFDIKSNQPDIVEIIKDEFPTDSLANTEEIEEEKKEDSNTNIQQLSHNKKALEFLAETETKEGESEHGEIDIKKIINQVLSILNEGRSDEKLNREQLVVKSEDLQKFITKLVKLVAEKTEYCFTLDKQNAALIEQAKTLKNVIGITKDLLGIRNMEVEHLHSDMKVMEDSISAERTRHDLLLKKLSEAVNLNEQLKNEYHTQSGLFQSLREKYHEKIILLTKENQRLQNLADDKEEEANIENGEVSTEVVEK